jgi:hypothetical protein
MPISTAEIKKPIAPSAMVEWEATVEWKATVENSLAVSCKTKHEVSR